MSIYETEDIFSVGPIDINVRVWHDDANGMQAEPLRYKVKGIWHGIGVNSGRDDVIQDIVADEYSERHLRYMRDEDPAFEGLPYDEPPVSQSEYEEMRV